MICSTCQQEFNPKDRDKYLSEFFVLDNPSICLDCLVKDLQAQQSSIHPKLINLARVRNHLRAAYIASANRFMILDKQYRYLDYEKNMILHKINMEKHQVKQATKPSKSVEQQTTDAIQAILNKLPKEQRDAVLAKYKNN